MYVFFMKIFPSKVDQNRTHFVSPSVISGPHLSPCPEFLRAIKLKTVLQFLECLFFILFKQKTRAQSPLSSINKIIALYNITKTK